MTKPEFYDAVTLNLSAEEAAALTGYLDAVLTMSDLPMSNRPELANALDKLERQRDRQTLKHAD